MGKYKHMPTLQQIKTIRCFPRILTHSGFCLCSIYYLACYLQTCVIFCSARPKHSCPPGSGRPTRFPGSQDQAFSRPALSNPAATSHLWLLSTELRHVAQVEYTSDFEGLLRKKNVSYLINNFLHRLYVEMIIQSRVHNDALVNDELHI